MSREKGVRGRPKGTGLDDSDRLCQIEAMIAKDPTLRPTTAIKAIGITDPSVIRRLRDKLAARETSGPVAAGLAAASAPVSAPRPRVAALSTSGQKSRKSHRLVEAPVSMKAAEPAMAPAPIEAVADGMTTTRLSSPVSEPADWMAMWCGLGLQALSTTAAIQMAVIQRMFAMPLVLSALKHQLMMGEAAVTLTAPFREAPRVLH